MAGAGGGDGSRAVAWGDVCDALRRLEDVVLAGVPREDARLRAEGLRYLTRFFAAGTRLCVELADPDHPELARMVDTTCSWGIDNPDCIYLYAAVRGDATYRIAGDRGSARHLDVQVSRGHFADAPAFGVIASLCDRDLGVAPGGRLDLRLSPEPGPGDRLVLAPDAAWVLVRQYFYDWETERPATLAIERVDAPYPPPALRPERVHAGLARLLRWLDGGAGYFDGLARMCLSRDPNSIVFIHPDDAGRGGLHGLAYGLGNFQCGPDDAVLLEVVPPRCHYWSFALGNRYWESLDWARRQTSLNGQQARLDADGVFRAVIAPRDPGVPNWLDPAGHEAGTLFGRYLLAESVPQPRLTRVPFAELRHHLPRDTPHVDPGARAEALRRRERAVRRRNRH